MRTLPGAPALFEGHMAAGNDAGYLGESSSKYLNHLKVALTSIRKSCPSIIPVVVVINNISVDTKRWITALGATVVKHDLTVAKHVYKTAALEEWSWIKGVISTYLRIEVPHALKYAAVLTHNTQPLKAQLLFVAAVCCVSCVRSISRAATVALHRCTLSLMRSSTCSTLRWWTFST